MQLVQVCPGFVLVFSLLLVPRRVRLRLVKKSPGTQADDGFTLDDNRTADPQHDDLPDMLAKWHRRDPKKDTDRKAKAFCVPAEEIRKNDYDLSINKYKEVVHEEVNYDPPKVILAKMKKLEAEILADLRELEGMLG